MTPQPATSTRTFAPRLAGVLAALAVTTAAPATFAQSAPLNVVATIGMIGDVVSEIGGTCVSVATLMGPGIDPHLYQATARDVQTLSSAELILYSGFGLEGQLGDVLERFGETVPTLAVASASVPTSELIAADDLYGIDPHLWMDPGLWINIVPVLAQTLSEQAPDCASEIEANAATYAAQLEALDQWAAQTIASIPDDQRILVTAHDAFAYFGRAYDIEVEGIQGISTQSEAGIADIRETAALLVEREIPAVFIESTINPRTIEAVIEAAGQQGHAVIIGAELYADAMGDDGTPDGTYIGMIYANVANIAGALGGTLAPLPAPLADWAQHWDIETAR